MASIEDYIDKLERSDIIDRNVLCALYGTFVFLFCASIYFLIRTRGNNHRARQVTLILSLTLLALFISTTAYTVSDIIYIEKSLAQMFISSTDNGLISLLQSCTCTKTATLTINILLGDAIVCWRAYSVWKGNRVVLGVSFALLMTTLALATVDNAYACTYSMFNGPGSPKLDPKADGDGSLYQGTSYGVAASVLSLSTNLYATTAVAVKAWQSRSSLRRYIVTGHMVSQTEKILSLLVESGVIYCAIWVVFVVYQAGIYAQDPIQKLCPLDTIDCDIKYLHTFWYIFGGIIVDSSLALIIAIYPTVIIILIAINRSHIENGFIKLRANQSNELHAALPLHAITVAADTAVTMRCDFGANRSSDTALCLGGQKLTPTEGMDISSNRAIEESKPGFII